MEIAVSARKHGVNSDEIHHAVLQAFRSYPQERNKIFIIGPTLTGQLLEIIVLDPDNDPVVIHAMPLRPKFYKLLR